MSLINKIKELFNEGAAVPETKFADAKTVDGQILKISEELKVGAIAEIVSEDGTTTPAKGDFELEDGTKISCDESGKISAITEAGTQEEEKETEMKEEETVPTEETVPAESNADFAQLRQEFDELREAFKMLVDGLKAKSAEMSAETTKLKTELSKAKAAPAVSFKKIDKTVTKEIEKPVSDMMKRIQELSANKK